MLRRLRARFRVSGTGSGLPSVSNRTTARGHCGTGELALDVEYYTSSMTSLDPRRSRLLVLDGIAARLIDMLECTSEAERRDRLR